MKLHDIRPTSLRRRRRRVGRGPGSGSGKTAGRGTKGQKARAGFNIPRRFEGGQTPFVQRLPKTSGFTTRSTRHTVVNVEKINALFREGERLSPKIMVDKGIFEKEPAKVKIIGRGKLNKFLRLSNVSLTRRLRDSLPSSPTKSKLRPQTTIRLSPKKAKRRGNKKK